MTNTQRVLAAVRSHPGFSDGELGQCTTIDSHQTVNQICRRLAQQGYLRRVEGRDGRIGNYLTKGAPTDSSDADSRSLPASRTARPRSLTPTRSAVTVPAPIHGDTLIVLPCSGRKTTEGDSSVRGHSVLKLLSPPLRDKLVKARRRIAGDAKLNEAHLCYARARYTGSLYTALNERAQAAMPMLIISGGYGLVRADEPIGWYKQVLRLGDWPPNLLPECLAAAAHTLKVTRVVAFCAESTDYAKLVRRTRWNIDAWLVTPDAAGRGGALGLVPKACGEAVGALLDGKLTNRWVSTDDVPIQIRRVD